MILFIFSVLFCFVFCFFLLLIFDIFVVFLLVFFSRNEQVFLHHAQERGSMMEIRNWPETIWVELNACPNSNVLEYIMQH